jgi:hypothetical protein
MAKADATINSAGVFLLLGPPEGPPSCCYKDRGYGLPFIGYDLFAVHFDLEGFSSLDPFLYSSIHHPNLILALFFRSTLA